MNTTASNNGGCSNNNNNNSSTPRRHTPSRRVVRTLNGQELSISIPDNFHQQHLHLTHHLQQQQQQQQLSQQSGSVSSMMVSPALPSPNFSNFMLTLSPLMQLSSPQPTMSPRDDMSGTGRVPSNMTPMVSTADEIPFAFQAGNDTAPTTTPATTNTHAAAQPSLAPPPLPTHALMPPPPPRVRPPREQEQQEHQHGHHNDHPHQHDEHTHTHEHQQRQEQQKQQQQQQDQQQQQQQQRLLRGEEERDPHNHHLPAQGSEAALENGGGTLVDKFHLMQMGVVDAGELMEEGKGSLLGPATPTMQGVVVMEGYPRSLAMGMGGGGEGFGASDGEEEEAEEGEEEEEGSSGAEEGAFGGRLGRRVVHRHGHAHAHGGEEAEEEEEEIYEAEGGYISSSSSDGTKSTMEQLQHDQRDLQSSQPQPHYSTSPAASAFSRRHGQGPSAAAVAAAAAAASSRNRSSSSSIHKKTGSSSSSNSASRPFRGSATGRRHSHAQELRRSPPPGAMAGGGQHPQARVGALGGGSVPASLQGPKKCNCRKSKCLKLYCECFAVGAYCQEDCGCLDCNNTLAFEHVRTVAVDSILSRNPHAFTEKIQFIEAGATGAVAGGGGRRASLAGGLRGEGGEKTVMGGMQGQAGGMLPTAAHVRGCNCKKSLCIKKYCECFFAGVYCGDNCQCEGCQNNHEASAGLHSQPKKRSGSAAKQKQQQQQQQQQASPSPSGPPTLSPTRVMESTTVL